VYQHTRTRSSTVTSILSDPEPFKPADPVLADEENTPHLWDTRALDTRALREDLDRAEDLDLLDLPYPSSRSRYGDVRREDDDQRAFVAAPRPRMPVPPVPREEPAPQVAPPQRRAARPQAAAPPPADLFLGPDVEPVPRRRDLAARRTRWREDMIAGLLSIALATGLYLDGWNHLNLVGDSNGPFLTPWSGLLYLAFGANVLFSLSRNQLRGTWSPRAIPPGYRLGAVGLALGVVALAGDAFWHRLFGEEQGLDRLISPFHLLLFLSLFLLSTSAFRSRWLAPTPRRVKRLQSFLPALCSAIAATSLAAFSVQYSSPLVVWARPDAAALPGDSQFIELLHIDGLTSVVLMNLVLMAPVLLILKRWHPPFGTVTWLFGGVALLMAGLTEFTRLGAVVATLAGGLVADLLIRYWRRGERRRSDNHVVAGIVPVALWTAHYLSLAFTGQAPNDVTVLIGAIVLASVTSVGLSMLMHTPAVPIPVMGDRTGELPPPPRLEDFSVSWEGPG
jgi:hypothetical protein